MKQSAPVALTAVDPRAFRRYSIGLSSGVELPNPDLWAALIAETAWTIAREWVRRYGVPFPWDRIEWRVEQDPELGVDRLRDAERTHP